MRTLDKRNKHPPFLGRKHVRPMILRPRNRTHTRHLRDTRCASQRAAKGKHEAVHKAHGAARCHTEAYARANGLPATEQCHAESEDREDVEAALELLALAHLRHDGFVFGRDAAVVRVGGVFDGARGRRRGWLCFHFEVFNVVHLLVAMWLAKE